MRLKFVGIIVIPLLGLTGRAQAPINTRAIALRGPENVAMVTIRPVPPELERHAATLHSALKAPAQSWIEQQARIEAQRPDQNIDALRSTIRQRFASSLASPATRPGGTVLGGQSGGDIDAIMFLVMMQIARDEEADLRDQMKQMQAVNQKKQQLRQAMNEMNRESEAGKASRNSGTCASQFCRSLPSRISELNETGARVPRPVHMQATGSISYQQLASLQDQMKQSLDSMNEMGEMESMRLQMSMDRRSKLIEALSNIEKKISNTDSGIVQNMK